MISLLAPAKLNLFLHINGRRPDGYHQLQTVFHLLNFGDTLKFSVTPSSEINLSVSGVEVPVENNLVLQAARLLQAMATQRRLGVDIELEKRLPLGAGLGGGSANAAATLVALNHLWQLNLPKHELARLGLGLGADVPVFVHGHSAWAEGVGEQLTPVNLPPCWYVVITPNCSVSTAEIFSHQQLTRDSQAIKMCDLLAGGTRNDCEAVTRMLYPEVDSALKWLNNHGEARMTGTGSSIFARFYSEASAEAVLTQLPDDMKGFVAKGVNKINWGVAKW